MRIWEDIKAHRRSIARPGSTTDRLAISELTGRRRSGEGDYITVFKTLPETVERSIGPLIQFSDNRVFILTGITFGKGIDFHFEDTVEGFMNDVGRHFGFAQFPVFECNGNFLDSEPGRPGCKFHFDLERIPDKPDLIKIQGIQYLALVADKASRDIVYGQFGD